MAVKTLLIDESEFIDFNLYGIISIYSDFPMMIYHVNRAFETKFRRIEDLDVLFTKQLAFFPIFEWFDRISGQCYHIIKNLAYTLGSSENLTNLSSLFEVAPALISQYKEYNYLLKVSGEIDDEIPFHENTFMQKITKLDTTKIKTINKLIF